MTRPPHRCLHRNVMVGLVTYKSANKRHKGLEVGVIERRFVGRERPIIRWVWRSDDPMNRYYPEATS